MFNGDQCYHIGTKYYYIIDLLKSNHYNNFKYVIQCTNINLKLFYYIHNAVNSNGREVFEYLFRNCK